MVNAMNIQSFSGATAASSAYSSNQTSETKRSQDAARLEQQAADQAQDQQQTASEPRPVANSSGQMTGTTINVQA